MISEATYKLLLASKLKGVGRQTLRKLSKTRLFFELEPKQWADDFPELRSCTPESISYQLAVASVEKDMAASQTAGGKILSWWDPGYPQLLRDVPDNPVLLYVLGDVHHFSKKAIAVVGTRKPTEHGRKIASRVTSHFASRGWQIVSGLAIGVDTVAHETALEVGSSTIAVLAHGLDSLYPKQNRRLADRIVDKGGLLISEYAYGVSGFPGNFVERDRIQAALACGVIMVQSDETGGSWHASRAALRYGRWLIVPEPTSYDVSMKELKIRGNLKLVHSSPNEQASFLQCELSNLDRLKILKSRDEYQLLEEQLLSTIDL